MSGGQHPCCAQGKDQSCTCTCQLALHTCGLEKPPSTAHTSQLHRAPVSSPCDPVAIVGLRFQLSWMRRIASSQMGCPGALARIPFVTPCGVPCKRDGWWESGAA